MRKHLILPDPKRFLTAMFLVATAGGTLAEPDTGVPGIISGETVPGDGVWIDPSIEKAQDRPIRVTVWFDRQFLGDGTAYERRAKEFANTGRRELRVRTVELLKTLGDRSFAAAKEAIDQLLATGEIRDLERHWIVNGFSCTTTAPGASALAKVPGVKKIFDTHDPVPLPATDPLPQTAAVTPATRPDRPATENLPWYIPLVRADRVWKEFGVAGEGTLNVVNDTNFILSPSNSSSIYQSPGEIPDNGLDDDGNGLIDDSHGYNFHLGSANLTTEALTGGERDKSILHGNNCANIICGSATAGVAPQFGIAPLGRWAGVASAPQIRITGFIESAIEWAIDHQADTYSMSYSIPDLGEFRSHWRKIMEQGSFCGLYFVSGAGNYGQSEKVPTQMRIPEDIPGAVFASGGIQRDLSRSPFSSKGPVEWKTEHYREGLVAKPDVCAFNTKLPLLLPDGTVREDTCNGNSYSGPMLGGIIALMLSADPDLLPWDARKIILDTATDVGPAGVDDETGHGLINCHKAVGEVLRRRKARGTAGDELLTLPVRFHIASDVTMEVKGQTMDMWVTPEDLEKAVISEVNRIWKQASIRFVIERCRREPLLSPGNRDELIRIVENSKRGDDESKESGRVASIDKLFDPKERHPTAQNVYLMPFIGSTYQGYARLGGTHAVVGVWTDKPFRGKKPPVKTLLVEPEPMRIGSLARTIAHELGHNLGLVHPPKDLPSPTARLMGGRIQGYLLTPEEIGIARKIARKHGAVASIR